VGRAIQREVVGGVVSPSVKQSNERFIVLKKKTRDALIGVRFGLHPISGQVVVTELFSGYPAMECGKIFVGDVLVSVNGVRITEVDMATQLIKLATDKVELKTSNVEVLPELPTPSAKKPVTATMVAPPSTPPPPPPPPPTTDLLVTTDLLGDNLVLDDLLPRQTTSARPAAAASGAEPPLSSVVNLLDEIDDLVLDEPDDFGSFAFAAPAARGLEAPAAASKPALTPAHIAALSAPRPAGYGMPVGYGMPAGVHVAHSYPQPQHAYPPPPHGIPYGHYAPPGVPSAPSGGYYAQPPPGMYAAPPLGMHAGPPPAMHAAPPPDARANLPPRHQ